VTPDEVAREGKARASVSGNSPQNWFEGAIRSGTAFFQGPMTPKRAWILTGGVCAVIALLGALIIGPNLRWPPGMRSGFPEIPSQPPPGSLRDDAEAPHRASPFAWFMLGTGTRFRAALEIQPPYDPEDGTTFRTEKIAIRIAGIDAPGMDAICFNAERQRWACGRQSRAALYNLIRNRALSCLPQIGVQGQPKGDLNLTPAKCLAEGTDIATEMIRLGFARSTGFPTPEQDLAQEQARAGMRGLWNGNWSVIP
jgi:endonuclease YncB( thermonuclease family)